MIKTPDTDWACPECPETFRLEGRWVNHLKQEHGIAPVRLGPAVADPSRTAKSDRNISTPIVAPSDASTLAAHHSAIPKLKFHVVYDLGQGDGLQPTRMTIPKDESYDKFLQRLRNVFYGELFERSLRQWEYVLVNRQYEKVDPLPLTSSNTYYAMVSELLRPRSRFRHAVIRRSHFENPIIRAIAEGNFHATPDTLVADPPASDNPLPDQSPVPDASQRNVSSVDIPSVAGAPQPDDLVTDISMSDAPTDHVKPELLTPTPPSKAWVIRSASAAASSRPPSSDPPSEANTQELSTPLTPLASPRGRRLLHLRAPAPPATRAQDPMRSYLPLVSSPLAPSASQRGRRSLQLGSLIASVTSTSTPSQLNPPPAPVARSQSPNLLNSSPSAPTIDTQAPETRNHSSLPPSTMAPCPTVLLGSTAPPAASFQSPSRQLSPSSATASIARVGSISSSPPSMQPSLPIVPTPTEQAPSVLHPLESTQTSPQEFSAIAELEDFSPPAVTTSSPTAGLPIASGSASLLKSPPELFKRSLTLPPNSTFESTSSVPTPPTNPTPVFRPRRPLWISSRRQLDRGVEYKVHWNSGRHSDSWEPHDSLYQGHAALVDKFLEGGR